MKSSSTPRSLAPLTFSVLAIIVALHLALVAWWWETSWLLKWTVIAATGAIAFAMIWWCSRYRRFTITAERKWETTREVYMNGLEVTLSEYFVDTNHGTVRVDGWRYGRIQIGRQYDVVAQQVDGILSVLLWR